MTKLLDEKPTPEIWSAIHGAICGEYNEEGFYNAIYNAAPPMPEPGEVERNLRLLMRGLDDGTAQWMEKAADLIAALQSEDYYSLWRSRAEKAEAERDAYQATADHHYSEAFKLNAENERLRKAIEQSASAPNKDLAYATILKAYATIDAARSKT